MPKKYDDGDAEPGVTMGITCNSIRDVIRCFEGLARMPGRDILRGFESKCDGKLSPRLDVRILRPVLGLLQYKYFKRQAARYYHLDVTSPSPHQTLTY